MTASPTPHPSDAVALREPTRLVSPRAKQQWRVQLLMAAIVPASGALAAWLWPGGDTWPVLAAGAVAVLLIACAFVVPQVRYRIHRWEVADDAIATRRGLLRIEDRIAPLSRVQTIDSRQSFLQRLFRVRSLVVTTASAAGPIMIDGLDAEEAQRLVAELTAITARERGDAT